MQIKKIKIKNFKSLKKIDITLSNLTLMTGINSGGKSSFIQSILLFKQNQERFYSIRGSKIININDKYINLGHKRDILFEEEFEKDIEIEISNNLLTHNLKFNPDNLEIKDIKILPEDKKSLFNIFYDDFQYISTDRITPDIIYPMSEEEVDKNLIGIKGEYTAHYLANNRHKDIIPALKHSKSQTTQLLENVSLWLSEITKNTEISNELEVKAKVYDELQQVNLTYSYTYGDNITKEYTPLNIGFGITYVLPVIVAILKAKKDDLIIIENPESHLHPIGQSKIAELCAIASANGVQIIIETHSDHFLNGIMIATKNKILKPEESKIYFFKKEQDELETKIDELNINSEGKIDKWPKDFFDQYENDLMELL